MKKRFFLLSLLAFVISSLTFTSCKDEPILPSNHIEDSTNVVNQWKSFISDSTILIEDKISYTFENKDAILEAYDTTSYIHTADSLLSCNKTLSKRYLIDPTYFTMTQENYVVLNQYKGPNLQSLEYDKAVVITGEFPLMYNGCSDSSAFWKNKLGEESLEYKIKIDEIEIRYNLGISFISDSSNFDSIQFKYSINNENYKSSNHEKTIKINDGEIQIIFESDNYAKNVQYSIKSITTYTWTGKEFETFETKE